jgi:drug/metabolite transporter (DMT)-like permease
MSLRDWFWIVLLGAIWGCSFLFNALLIREIGPLWVSAGRVSVGALGCWAFCLATRRAIPQDLWALVGPLFVLGVVGYTLPFALFPLSEAHLPSGLVAVVNALTPMTTVIVSQFWPGGERATLVKSSGVAIGFVGATILALPSLLNGGSADAWAIAACLAATLCYAITLNYARRFNHIDPAVLAASALTASAVVGIPVAFAAEGTPVMTRPESVLALLGIGLASTTFAFILMYRLLPRVGPTNFSVTTFIAPVSAVILGITLLHEVIAPTEAVGIVLIFAGLIVMDGRLVRRLRRRKFETV